MFKYEECSSLNPKNVLCSNTKNALFLNTKNVLLSNTKNAPSLNTKNALLLNTKYMYFSQIQKMSQIQKSRSYKHINTKNRFMI